MTHKLELPNNYLCPILIIGNSQDILKDLPDNCIDSIVTDAPYGLGKEPDANKMLTAWLEHGYLEVKGKGFMGKEWDAFVPQPAFWKEAIRVLKPGGHVLSFFGTRTYDWGVMAMRLAGFEIRDCIQWLYGSGFPKSMDISKAIDREAGVERRVTKAGIIKASEFSGKFDQGSSDNRERRDMPATDEAKQWDGWGTALKPANEPIVLARKPIEKGLTVAENVLKWGVGGLNIDGCRVEFQSERDYAGATFVKGIDITGGNYGAGQGASTAEKDIPANPKGRFPANIILDEEAALCLDEHTGVLKSGAMNKSYEYKNNGYSLGKPTGSTRHICESSEGGASRFFYCAKASQSERNAGLEDRKNTHPTVKPVSLIRYLVRMVTPKNGISLDPFAGSGTHGIGCILEGIRSISIERDESQKETIELRWLHWEKEAKEQQDIQMKLF